MIQWALDNTTWDTYLAGDGNPRLVKDDLELAQAVACKVRVFIGEDWTDDGVGIPYYLGTLKISFSQLTEYMKIEAFRDSRVTKFNVKSMKMVNRKLTGTIQINGAVDVGI